MTVRDSRTQARARTPGAEDDPTSTTVRDRALGPTQCGISDVATKGHEGRTQTKYLPVYAGSRLKLAMCGKAPSEMSALQPYRGKPAVRNDRGDRGNVGIIEARSAPRSYPTAGPVEYATKPLSTPTGGKIVPCSLKKRSQRVAKCQLRPKAPQQARSANCLVGNSLATRRAAQG